MKHEHAAPADLSKNQSIVVDVLARSGKPLSAYQILDQTHALGVRAPQQVYRALERLLELHLVHRIESLNAYQFCEKGPHQHQAAFAICTKCRATAEFSLQQVVPSLDQAAKAIKFTVASAHVEVSGLCDACKTMEAALAKN